MAMNFISDDVKRLIGAETDFVPAPHPVEASEVRRFHHATMDYASRYRADVGGRYDGPVAPPAFPVHAFRRAAEEPDPLDAAGSGDFDGTNRSFRGLPSLGIPLPRLLNGGYQYELFRYARVGETILRKSRYKDIYQKDSKNGPLVFILLEDEYRTGHGEPLLNAINTIILR